MRSMLFIRGLGDGLGGKESELNERIAEKEMEGWEVVDMQVTPPSFGSQPVIILRLAKESN